jgi:hypothetical protein
MKRRSRHLGRTNQIKLVPLDAVDVDGVRGKEAGAIHRFLAHEHGREHRDVTLLRHARERIPVERHLQQRQIAQAIDKPRSGGLRAARRIEPSVRFGKIEMIPSCEGERRLRAHFAEHLEILFSATRHVVSRRIGHAIEKGPTTSLQFGKLRLGLLKLLFRPLQFLPLLRRRLPGRLQFRAQRLRRCRCRAPCRVQVEQFLTEFACALAGQFGQVCLGVATQLTDVDHCSGWSSVRSPRPISGARVAFQD